jgi:hypothetical protein
MSRGRERAGARSHAGPVPEDRFGDLGRPDADDLPAPDPARDGDRWPAAERLAELDELRPEELPGKSADDASDESRRRQGRYMGIVGVAFAALILVAAFNCARDRAEDRDLLRGLPPGVQMPAFAAPLATGTLEGDANVKQRAGPEDAAGGRPACEVRSAEVVNLCALRERPVALTFVVGGEPDCMAQLELVERTRGGFPEIAFASVVSGEAREEVAALARARRIRMPVAVDRDGAILNAFRVGVCPTTVFAQRGGEVRATRIGRLSERELRDSLRALSAESR